MSFVTRVQKTFSELEYTGKKKQTRRDRFLADLEQLVPWAQVEAQVAPFYSDTTGKRGRPAIGLSRMLRMYVVQQCFGLSDEGTEDAVYDSQAIRGFIGIDLGRESAPDATTLLRFRRLLETHQLTRVLHGAETYVSGDAGYTGAAKRPEHAERDVVWSIAARPSSYKHHGKDSVLYRVKRKVEYAKAQLRAKVEHPFQMIKVRFNHRKVRYRGLEKNTAQLFSLFGLANLVLAKRYLQRTAG